MIQTLLGDRPPYQVAALEVAKKTETQVYDALVNKFEGTVFRELTVENKFKVIAQAVNQCKVFTGQKNNVNDTIHETQVHEAIYEGISLDYFSLTDKEILHAVKLGLIGSYGTNGSIVMVTPIQIFEWLKSYVNTVKPKATKIMLEARRANVEEAKPVVNTEETWISILKDWIEAKKRGEENNYSAGHFVYDLLVKKECPMVVPSDEERDLMKKRARNILVTRKAVNANIRQQKYLRDIAKGVLEDKQFEKEVLREAKSMAIQRFVELLVNEEINLDDLI